jgi:hypothetical protein
MAQTVKIIDLAQSYVPGDPNAFPDNLRYTAQEDAPEQEPPILAYAGANFLPTHYGYRSYFGVESALTLAALTKPCDQIIAFQSKTYENMLIAFCSDGIRTAKTGDANWTHSIVLPDEYEATQTYKQYTHCVIENNLYIYRQGYSKVIKIDESHVITEFTPSFLNMAGQMGIFRGNGRLCFWDSEDSVAWSSAFDLTDFTPSIENMVGNSTFLGVLGRIVNILPHGEGFVIYCTRSIVGVSYSTSGSQVWDAMTINSNGGIAHPGACCIGQNDKEHFAYTSFGIIQVGHYNALSRQYDAKIIIPEVFDFLKESRTPVYMQCHAARYLYISVIDDAYITGTTTFTGVSIPTLDAPGITIDASYLEGLGDSETANTVYQYLYNVLRNPTGNLITDETLDTFDQAFWTADFNLPVVSSVGRDHGLLTQNADSYLLPDPPTTSVPSISIITTPEVYTSLPNTAEDGWASAHTGDTDIAYQDGLASYLNAHILFHSPPQGIYDRTHYPGHAYNFNYLLAASPDNYTPFVGDNLNPSPNRNVMDVLFALEEAWKEFDQIYLPQYAAQMDALVSAGTTPVSWILYSDGPVVVDNDQSEVAAEGLLQIRVPKAESIVHNVKIRQEPSPLGGSPTIIDLWRTYAHHDVYDFSTSTRQVLATTSSNYLESDLGTGNVSDEMLQLTQITYRIKLPVDLSGTEPSIVFNKVPTWAEIVAGLNSTPIVEFSTGHTWELVNSLADATTPNAIWSATSFNAHTITAVIRNTTTNTLRTDALLTCWDYYSTDEVDGIFTVLKEDDLFYEDYDNLDLIAPSAATQNAGYCSIDHLVYLVNELAQLLTNIGGGIQTIWGDLLYIQPNTAVWSNHPSVPGLIRIRASKKLAGEPSYAMGTIVLVQTPVIYKNVIQENVVCTKSTPAIANPDFFKDLYQGYVRLTHTDNYQIVNGSTGSHTTITSAGDVGVDNLLMAIPNYEPAPSYYQASNCEKWVIEDARFAGPNNVFGGANFMFHAEGKLLSKDMVIGPVPTLVELPSCIPYGDIGFDGGSSNIPWTYPGATFQLQNGIPAPAYPTLVGSYVLDLHLKKWGKQAGNMKALLQYAPINNINSQVIPYTNFGMDSGILAEDGTLHLFSVNTPEGNIRYGKIGLYRLGWTELLEITINFRTSFTGDIIVDGSTDARDTNDAIQHVESFVNVRQAVVKCHVNARWHTISLLGNFDLQYMEFRAIMAARR